MFDVGEEMETGRGTMASRPKTGQGATASLPEMIALRPEMTVSLPEMKVFCNADD